jgi:hypothetical protein
MILKSIIALLMGLVIQLSQVPPCLMGGTEKSCATSEHGMECCAEMQSCPCVEEGGQTQKPTPLIPESVALKVLYLKAAETNRLETSLDPPADVVRCTESAAETRSGYAGVPLSVAFCCFVI